MAKEQTPAELYETIRNAGFLLETQLNEFIQKHLNKEELVGMAAIVTKAHTKLIEFLHEFQEIISVHLNTPTKNDVANVAKLVVQTEEKVDSLTDEIIRLTESIDQLKELSSATPDNGSPDSNPPEPSESSPALNQRELTKMKLRETLYEISKAQLNSMFENSPSLLGIKKALKEGAPDE